MTTSCAMCFEPVWLVKTPCCKNQSFCPTCLNKVNKCPNCRQPISFVTYLVRSTAQTSTVLLLDANGIVHEHFTIHLCLIDAQTNTHQNLWTQGYFTVAHLKQWVQQKNIFTLTGAPIDLTSQADPQVPLKDTFGLTQDTVLMVSKKNPFNWKEWLGFVLVMLIYIVLLHYQNPEPTKTIPIHMNLIKLNLTQWHAVRIVRYV